MNKLSKLSLFAFAIALVFGLAFSAAPAFASENTFDLTVKHNINGRSLGLDKALPVDIYVNGALAIPNFTFGETVNVSLPAGEYAIKVNLAGTDATVMSLGATEIPAGVDVTIKAQLSADKTPTLKVRVNK